jgi:hypothetical protein
MRERAWRAFWKRGGRNGNCELSRRRHLLFFVGKRGAAVGRRLCGRLRLRQSYRLACKQSIKATSVRLEQTEAAPSPKTRHHEEEEEEEEEEVVRECQM